MSSSVPLPPGYGARPVRLDDAEAVAAAYDRNREHLAPWDPTRPPDFFTPEGQREALGRQLELVELGQLAAWVLVRGDEVVGRVNLNNVVRGVSCSASLGYWVDREHLRRGLARAAVEHACAESRGLGLHRVEAGTLVHLFIAGRWQDHHLYQRLLHDDPPPGQPV